MSGQEITRLPRPEPVPARLLELGIGEDCNGNGVMPNPNPNHILPAGTKDTDLRINGITCTVDGSGMSGGVAGSYLYRNVNIYNGGTLTFDDKQIDFHAHSILVEMNSTLEAGATSPLNGPLTIWLWGTQTDGIPSITCLSKNDAGEGNNECGVPHAAWISNPNVPMHMPSPTCVPGSTVGFPLPNNDCFYQYEVFDTGDIAGAYFGRKVLAVSAGGNLILRGAKGIRTGTIETSPADSGTSWAHLTMTLAGNKTVAPIYIDRAVPTWGKGDHIVVTSTDYLPGHTEEFVIKDTGSDANGTYIDIDTSQPAPMNTIQYPHWGVAYDYSGIVAANPGVGPVPDTNLPSGLASHIETRAIVALLSRSIRVASEGADPVVSRTAIHFPQTQGNYYGGHTVVRDGFASYRVQGVELYQLGQGGALGRYPVHFHMARSVPQPDLTQTPPFLGTYLADSSIVDSMTRFVTVHATQGITLARNVGYKSIGHGYYLEDATEINNRLYSNVGISVRGALADEATNPRMVPGILDVSVDQMNVLYPSPDYPPVAAGGQIPDRPPYNTDVITPTTFWITNTWNDFEYNVAVGAGACGACYWMPPMGVSGPSQYESWNSYASMQKSPGLYGAVPLLTFKGNSCSAAMAAIVTVGQTNACLGVLYGKGVSDTNRLVSVTNPNPIPTSAYPNEGAGQREKTTICDANHQSDCSTAPPCTGFGPNLAGCAPFVIDHFTTSFNWAPTNFSSVWLRGWWYLLENSAITDIQNGGVTFISGGGYTRSDAAQGYWSVLKNSILVGNTQPNGSDGFPANPFASNAGPFTPKGIICPYNPAFCVSLADGIVFVGSNFATNQRLFNIYDGPSSEINDIYADVHVTNVGTVSACKALVGGNDYPGNCQPLNYMNADTIGVLQTPQTNQPGNTCFLPNAAIAWKQPNGFYYPPAFNSDHLVFSNVDIRHFVIQPQYLPNSFTEDATGIKNTYCTWQPGMFSDSFTDIDRQTELTDNDGSLTGLTANDTQEDPSAGPTISVTKDKFYNAPLVTDECASGQPAAAPTSNDNGATVDTSPYEYFTTALVAECALNGANCNGNWTQDNCSTPTCYGVPLYRQSITADESSAGAHPSIRMMGQASAQRSTLTLNHANYYIDTTVPLSVQNPNNGGKQVNVFQPNQSYDIFFLFAGTSAKQSYTMFIGTGLTDDAAAATITPGRMPIPDNSFKFDTDTTGPWATFGGYNSTTGILTVNIDLSNQEDLKPEDRSDFCQPTTYCAWSNGACGCKTGSGCTDPNVCALATKELDCPVSGCYGFRITMPGNFEAVQQTPPAPGAFTDPYFVKGTVTFAGATNPGNCAYSPIPTQPDALKLGSPRSIDPKSVGEPIRWPNP